VNSSSSRTAWSQQQIQGPKARYKGLRKNTLDLRRVAAVTNLQRVARQPIAA
jgi:hypothetical protein